MMRGGAVRSAGRCFGLTVAASMSAAASAQQAQTGLIVSTGVSAESNPYNSVQSGGGVAATAEVQPQAQFRTESSTLYLSGLAQFRQFFRRYGLEDNYAANAALTSRQSDQLTLRASGSASYNEGGYGNFGRPGLSPLIGPLPDTTTGGATGTTVPDVSLTDTALASQLPLLTDATVLGLRTRTTAYSGSAGFDGRLSGRSRLSGDVNARALRYRSGLLSNYDNAGVELRYGYQLNELSSVGVIGGVDLANYHGTRVGDTVTKTALLSYDRRFGRGWALSAGAGATFSSIRQLAGQPNAHLTALSLRGSFCRQGQYDRFCIDGARSPQPAANGAVRISNSASATYSRRLNDLASVTVSGSYARTERGRALALNLPSAEFISGSARYDRRLGERSTFYASGSVSKVSSVLASRATNFGVAAGVQFRFGGLK